FLVLIGLVALWIDVTFSFLSRHKKFWLLETVACSSVFLFTAVTDWNALQIRRTNLDLAASRLEQMSAPNDLIVLDFVFHGITFQRYYQGRTPWTTAPEIKD